MYTQKGDHMTGTQMEKGGYSGCFRDVYRFFQQFSVASDSETFWNAAAAEADTIYRRYEKTQANKLTIDLLLAVYNQLERAL